MSKYKRIGGKVNLEIRENFLEKEGTTEAVVYLGVIPQLWLDKKSGEEKVLNKLVLLDPETGDRFLAFQNAGLKSAMDGSVDVGDLIEVTFNGKRDIGGGRTMNTYDIYQLEKTAEIKAMIAKAPRVTAVATPVLGAREEIGTAAHA